MRVLVSDAIAEAGIELLRTTEGFEVDVRTDLTPDQLREELGSYDGLVVRSGTKVTAEILGNGGRLRAIGRAGTGVDNIDLDAATAAGVVVMNTPGGNSVAAAEHTIALLTGMARNVPQAHADLKAGAWNRKQYMGIEITGKTVGVVGLGRIGREVARRARGLQMEVQGYDPFVNEQAAADFGVAYRELDDLLRVADFVTLHLPLNKNTRHILDGDRLRGMKAGARLINCARGGLIDEVALLEALESGHLAGAAADVFESEPPAPEGLVSHPAFVCTPHLGASTIEAQERVGTEISEKVRDFLVRGVILDAVNFPSIDRDAYASLGPLMGLTETLGRFVAQVVDGGARRLEVRALGEFSDQPLKPLAMAAAKGLLSPAIRGGVSYVNALSLAESRGVTVEEARSSESGPYTGLVRVTVETDRDQATVAGTLYTSSLQKIVEIDGVNIEVSPDGHMLVCRNRDVPGVFGKIGSILGRHGVNIGGIMLGRRDGSGDQAVSVIGVDSPVPGPAIDEMLEIDEVVLARSIEV